MRQKIIFLFFLIPVLFLVLSFTASPKDVYACCYEPECGSGICGTGPGCPPDDADGYWTCSWQCCVYHYYGGGAKPTLPPGGGGGEGGGGSGGGCQDPGTCPGGQCWDTS